MTLRDQIEAHTNAANTSAVWKHLKRPEREMLKSLQAWNTDSERLLSAASHVSDEKRKGLLVTVMIEICGYCDDWNGLKRLVNKLQNVMFSKTRTNCMYSNSAARAHGASVQSLKHEEILRWNTVTHHLLIFINFFEGVWQIWYMWQTSSQIRNEIYPRNICMLLSTKRSTEVFLRVSAKIKAPSTFIHFSIVIVLLLFFTAVK